ncbi:phospholipase carboxylesterase family protein [Trichoderma cornu-damae]|uniref:Phospholipase carboxylesterase family protein n=1 Tax=Trichoderma cornu-damae TaxID=654480 RepID=A0A9P8TXD1_9HYPO|nr:phospholipase carboxylesterase family protein [Trichoderma cornu-damae]
MSWRDRYQSYLEPLDPIRYGIWDEHFVRFETNSTVVPTLVPQCSGVVLELGPGLGNQLCRFDKSKISRIVGVEVNPHFAPDCRQQILKHGLEDVYELVVSGVQESDVLEKHGVVAESLDTVLSIQVLCSVPDADAMAKEIYRLLKPGGRLIFWEHHRNSDWLTAAVQYFWNPIWRPLIGGCSMTRNMRAVLAGAGEWENYDGIEGDEQRWSMLPRVWGVLVKPKA